MLRLLLITCLVATAASYGRPNYQKTGSAGCSSPAGCPSSGGVPAGNRRSSGGGGYWWSNNNPFVNTPQRGPSSVQGSAGGSKKPIQSKYPSSGGQSYPSAGASGFPAAGGLGSASGGFGSQPSRVNQFVGPMGICPRDFICVHWQLCKQGQVILDGSGLIDKSKRRPSQGYNDLRRCGDDMFCCGVAPGYTAQGVFDTLTSTLPIGSSETTESVFGTNSFLSSSHISSQRIDSQIVPDHASSISISHSSSGAASTNPNVAPSLIVAPGESVLLNAGHDSVAGHGNVNNPFSVTHSNNFDSTHSQSFGTSGSVKENDHPSLSNPNFAHANLNAQSHTSQVSNPGVQREESAFSNLEASSSLSGSANNVVSSGGISEPSSIPNELLSYLPPHESPDATNTFVAGSVSTPIAQEDIRISQSLISSNLKPTVSISNEEIVGLKKQPDVFHPLSDFIQDEHSSHDDQNLGEPSRNQNIDASSGVLTQSVHGSSIPSQTNQAPSQELASDDSYSGTSNFVHSSQVSGQVQPSQNPVGSFDNPSSTKNVSPQSHSSTPIIGGSSDSSSFANLAPVRDQVPIDFPSTQTNADNQPSQLSGGSHSTSLQIDSSPLIEQISGVQTPSLSQSLNSQQLGSHSQSFDHHKTSPSTGLDSNVAVDRINEQVPQLASGYLPPSISPEGPSPVVSEQSIKQSTLPGGSGSFGSGGVISSSQGGSQSFGQSSFQGSSLKPVKPVSGGASSGSFGQGQVSSGGSYNPGSSGSVSHQSSSSGSFGQSGVGIGGSQKPLVSFPQPGGSGCAGGSAPGCGEYNPSAGGSASIQQGSRFPSGGSGSAGAGGYGPSGSVVNQPVGSLSGSSAVGGSSGSFPSGSGSSSGGYGGSSGSFPSGSGSSSGTFPVGGGSLPTGSAANYPSSSGSASGSSGSFPSGGGTFPGGSVGSSGSFPGGSGSLHTSSGANYPSGSGSSSASSSSSSGSFPSGGGSFPSGGGSFPSGSGGSSGSFPGSSGTGSGSFPAGSGSLPAGSGANYPSSSGASSGSSGGFPSSSGNIGSSGSGGYGSSGSVGGSSGVGSSGSFPGSSGSFPSGSGSSSGSFPSGTGGSSGGFPSGSGSGAGAGGYGPQSGIANNQPANPGSGGPFNQLGLPSQPGSSGVQQTQPMNQMMMGMMGMGGNPLVPGSCSAGTFCVPRFQCNPYNGFIIMDPNQLQAVWPDAPQVPLLDCIIPAGVLNDGVCCQQQHPIVGPNGQILD